MSFVGVEVEDKRRHEESFTTYSKCTHHAVDALRLCEYPLRLEGVVQVLRGVSDLRVPRFVYTEEPGVVEPPVEAPTAETRAADSTLATNEVGSPFPLLVGD